MSNQEEYAEIPIELIWETASSKGAIRVNTDMQENVWIPKRVIQEYEDENFDMEIGDELEIHVKFDFARNHDLI